MLYILILHGRRDNIRKLLLGEDAASEDMYGSGDQHENDDFFMHADENEDDGFDDTKLREEKDVDKVMSFVPKDKATKSLDEVLLFAPKAVKKL